MRDGALYKYLYFFFFLSRRKTRIRRRRRRRSCRTCNIRVLLQKKTSKTTNRSYWYLAQSTAKVISGRNARILNTPQVKIRFTENVTCHPRPQEDRELAKMKLNGLGKQKAERARTDRGRSTQIVWGMFISWHLRPRHCELYNPHS